jgi:hypothetical protein
MEATHMYFSEWIFKQAAVLHHGGQLLSSENERNTDYS